MLSQEIIEKGFCLVDVDMFDLNDYIHIKRLCLKKYIDENPKFFGEWNDKNVTIDFNEKINQTLFQKLLLHNEAVGFLSYDITMDKISGISINLIEKVQNNGIGSLYLTHIIHLSQTYAIPIFLYVMKTNPAQYLYERFGFKMDSDTEPLCLMVYNP